MLSVEKLLVDAQVTMVWYKVEENTVLKKWSKKRSILEKLEKGKSRTIEKVKLVGPEGRDMFIVVTHCGTPIH